MLRHQSTGHTKFYSGDPALQRTYLARPERLRELLKAAGKVDGITTLVIGEMQKVPALLDVLHDEIEQRSRPHRSVSTIDMMRACLPEGSATTPILFNCSHETQTRICT